MKQTGAMLLALVGVLLWMPLPATATSVQERSDWSVFFEQASVDGTIVVFDERSGGHFEYQPERAATRFLPASTFKIPHALFALDAGIVDDEFQRFQWDGTQRSIPAWNADHDLRSAMRQSVVWVYQAFARIIGEARLREYMQGIDYGNADPVGGVDRFWLDGGLRISAREQVAFLQRLYRNQLPFAEKHQRLVKDLMIVEAADEWILRAKTGWQVSDESQLGWWVGWVEHPDGAVFFALNINTPNGAADLSKRQSIARAILASIDGLPGS